MNADRNYLSRQDTWNYEQMLEAERKGGGVEGLEEDAAFISVRDVHGYSISPMLLPGSNGGVAYATGPFLVIWNWKVSLSPECHTKNSLVKQQTDGDHL